MFKKGSFMKNVIRTTTSGFKNKVRGGGVLSKTLLTTAIFTALTSASITSQAQTQWFFDYGKDFSEYGGGAKAYNGATYSGLELTGASGNFNAAITGLASGLSFKDTGYDAENHQGVLLGNAANYSVLIVGATQPTVTAAATATIAITMTSGATTVPPSLTGNFSGLTVLDGGKLDLSGVTEEAALAITLTGGATNLPGLNLVGVDLSQGGDFVGAEATGTEQLAIQSYNANATVINVGNGGTYQIGTKLSGSGGTGAATATVTVAADYAPTKAQNNTLAAIGALLNNGNLADGTGTTNAEVSAKVDLNNLTSTTGLKVNTVAAGLSSNGGETILDQAATVTFSGEIDTFTGYTGTATAYGVQVNGGAFKSTKGTTSTTISGTVTGQSSGAAIAGEAYAYGIMANDATVEIVAGGATASTITGTVSSGGAAVFTAEAYGLYAVGGTNLTFTGGSNASTITGQVSDGTGTALATNAKAPVEQIAAGLWIQGKSTATINAGVAATTTITGKNMNQVGDAGNGNLIGVYGIYAENSTLNLTGTINVTATGTGAANVEKAPKQYDIAALSANNVDINITGYTTDAQGNKAQLGSTGSVITLNQDSEIVGGNLNIIGGDAASDAGGKAKLGLAATAGLILNGTTVYLTAGKGSSAAAAAGGTADFAIGSTATITGATFQLEGGAAGTQGAGGNSTITLGDGVTTLSGGTYTLTGGNSNAGNNGGNASIVSGNANSGLTLVNGAQIELVGGTETEGAGNAGTASIDLSQTGGTGALTLGIEGTQDNSSISIGNGAALTLNNTGGGTAYDGTTITVGVGGNTSFRYNTRFNH